jgi:DNA-binding IclR family transcriptional regulator
MNDRGDSYNVRSVERAVAVLGAVAAAHGPLKLSQIASRSELSVPTTFRLVRTLEGANLLISGDDGKYGLGSMVLELSEAFIRNLDLPTIAKPFLASVRDKVRESTSLTLRSGDMYFHATIVESDHTLRRVPNIGRQRLLHLSPGGLIFLAFDSEGDINKYIARIGLGSREVWLKKMLSQIREQEYAEAIEQDGLAKIAAPVRSHEDVVRAGIYVSGPSTRFGSDGDGSWLAAARDAASELSRVLGRKA